MHIYFLNIWISLPINDFSGDVAVVSVVDLFISGSCHDVNIGTTHLFRIFLILIK